MAEGSSEVKEAAGPGPVPSLPPGGAEEEERFPGGAAAAVGSAPDAGEKEVDPEQCPKLPDATVSKSGPSLETTGAVRRKSSHRTPSVRNNPLSPNLRHRLSLKTKGRKSLPPIHQDVTELSKAISLDLPEGDRLFELLFSSFQFAAQKLEQSLKHKDGFNPEAFRSSAQSAGEDLKYSLQQLRLKGTLQRCVQEPQGVSQDLAVEESVAEMKEHMARLTAESHAWDELLLRHQESAEEAARRLEERRDNTVPVDYLHTSQAEVLRSKPNYQQILAEQREVLTSMELLSDELQQTGQLLQTVTEESKQYLQCLSKKLAARTFGHLEQSPVRKLIAGPPRRQRQPLH
ncbi:multivesicular body subunit 12A isoform X1 [Melopsittacus undulatus]|uniref:multivesicular body subunit 12A isoform X1 n=1 Tax=Melopsittacus undulatus TaxID=13146 RepID=UPI00146AF5FA|nr:multivesicular body subunit 12A isoform X1 [Melopsittacus undulatus]